MMRFLIGLSLVGAMFSAALADTTIVNETFESYADDSGLFAVWGSGNGTNFRLADMSNNPVAFPTGGKGAEHLGGTVAEWINLNGGSPMFPSETQSIVVEGDIFHDGVSGNKRMSLGLRGPSANLVELGFYNTNSCDPTVCGPGQAGGTSNPQNAIATDPGYYPGTAFGYRMQLFQSPVAEPLLVQPDWQYPLLPIELDRPADTDTIVNLGDVGAGWHHYKATIRPDSITVDIDLFRDGLRNTSITPDGESGIRPGTPGVDGTATWGVVSTSAGYSSLRVGGPSGVASGGGGVVFDNIKLSLVDVVVGNTPDFNGNTIVDAADYSIWRDHLGLTGTATQATGDANGDTNVDQTDYNLWKAAFGTTPGSGSGLGGAAVPEPTSMILFLLGTVMLTTARPCR